MSPSPQFNFAESKPCSDPSHGDGFQADVQRALCKEPKVLRLARGGTVYNVHASSVAIRGGGSTSTVKRSNCCSGTKSSSSEESRSSAMKATGGSQLTLRKGAPNKFVPGGTAPTNITKRVVFESVKDHAPAPEVAKNIDMSTPHKPASKTRTATAEMDPVAHQKRPHARTQRTRAALRQTKALISMSSEEHGPTPPAALSAKGRALKALQEWEAVEKPCIGYAEEEFGAVDKEASGVEETEDGWMVV